MPCEPARTAQPSEARPRGTILIVEDEVLIRFALADFLRDNKYKVYEAHDAEEAIQLLSFYRASIDVVFADVRLPGALDGFRLAQWVQAHRPEASIILGSGYRVDLATVGVSNVLFFSKPYDLKTVRTSLADLMQQRRAQT
jgi:DNA-binding NtrC family response regulator